MVADIGKNKTIMFNCNPCLNWELLNIINILMHTVKGNHIATLQAKLSCICSWFCSLLACTICTKIQQC